MFPAWSEMADALSAPAAMAAGAATTLSVDHGLRRRERISGVVSITRARAVVADDASLAAPASRSVVIIMAPARSTASLGRRRARASVRARTSARGHRSIASRRVSSRTHVPTRHLPRSRRRRLTPISTRRDATAATATRCDRRRRDARESTSTPGGGRRNHRPRSSRATSRTCRRNRPRRGAPRACARALRVGKANFRSRGG